MKIKFSYLTNDIELNKNINIFSINNFNIMNKLYYSFRNEFDDTTLIIDEHKEIDFKKVGQFLSDPFSLDINSKKNLQLLYEKEKKFLSIENLNNFEKIKTKLFELIGDIISNSNYELDYNDAIDIVDTFALLKLQFSVNNELNFFDYFCKYLNIISNLKNLKLIITYNFLSFFNNKQIESLNIELKKAGLLLLDIVFNDDLYNKKYDLNIISIYRIDQDYCEY